MWQMKFKSLVKSPLRISPSEVNGEPCYSSLPLLSVLGLRAKSDTA